MDFHTWLWYMIKDGFLILIFYHIVKFDKKFLNIIKIKY